MKEITSKLPDRKDITLILEKIAKYTIDEIKSIVLYSSSNSITFDCWTSKNNTPYLGITIRSLINFEYHDFFLDLIEITSEKSLLIAGEVSKSLENYGIDGDDIISCTTDNCNVMCAAANELNIWRIPCVCHMLNKIFEVFIKGC